MTIDPQKAPLEITKKKNWFARHKIITGLIGLFIIGSLGNANQTKLSTSNTYTSTPVTAVQDLKPAAQLESKPVSKLEPIVVKEDSSKTTSTSTPTEKPESKVEAQVTTKSNEVKLSNDTYYTNSSGAEIHSPAYSDTIPAGASAKCKDGTYSFSTSRRGTCSRHGGVSIWY